MIVIVAVQVIIMAQHIVARGRSIDGRDWFTQIRDCPGNDRPTNIRRPMSLIAALVFVLLSPCGCGNVLEDNGTHLAYALEKGTRQLRASTASELVVRYDTLDQANQPYYVEITPSIVAGQASKVWGSYLVVSGKNSGGTSYHNRFVFVPERLYLKKDLGGPAQLVLRKDGEHISVVELR
jgi:hypothetical protein